MSNRNVNRIILDGRLVRDMEMNQQGTVGKFSLACNESQKGLDGSWSEYANFFDVKVFGKTAQNLRQYLVKGKRVIVDGRLHQERWEKGGQKFSRVVVNAGDVVFCGGDSGGQDGGPSGGGRADGRSRGGRQSGGGGYEDGDDFPEDIPF